MKRKLILFAGTLCAALLLSPGWAAAQNAKPPTQLTYQGFLTDANGVPFGNTAPVNKTVIFRIYDNLTGGTLKWSSQQVVTVDKGYFSVLLGQGSAGPEGTSLFNGDLTGIFTGAGASDRYLELTADGTTIAPRLRFFPSPYAMLAKSATEVADPVTGATVLTVSGGNLTTIGNVTAAGTITGNGTALTNLNASQITSGTMANARTTATSGNTANAIVARDGSGNFSAGTITASSFTGNGASLTTLNAGQITSGTLANARTTATSANTANAIVARDSNGSIGANRMVANSFKIANTPTLVLSSISRGSLFSAAPVPGVSQTFANANHATANGRQNVNKDANWWKANRTDYGTILYTGTFTVPAGEVWEVAYTCRYYWYTDDNGNITWTLNDALLDDAVITAYGLPRQHHLFNQTFVLTGGQTHTARVKAVIGDGSGSDVIYFPAHTPSHLVVRKYKSN